MICEGEKTENQYFKGIFNHRAALKIHQLIDIVVIEQEEGVTHIPHPVHIVNGCVNLIDNEDGPQKDLINYDSKIDEIWVVFDRDPKTFFEHQYNEIIEKCGKYGINIGFTNPTFEFWLLLHLPNINQYDESILLMLS
ncbi:RloB family protein [Fusibacter sp. 3D3]|uniref:RloB family protein n=1 Tax=Fusibacter sp. 3D3 TaxID=1048380 RepID=UPI000A059B4B